MYYWSRHSNFQLKWTRQSTIFKFSLQMQFSILRMALTQVYVYHLMIHTNLNIPVPILDRTFISHNVQATKLVVLTKKLLLFAERSPFTNFTNSSYLFCLSRFKFESIEWIRVNLVPVPLRRVR